MKKGYLVLLVLMVFALLIFSAPPVFSGSCAGKCLKGACAAGSTTVTPGACKCQGKCTCCDKCTCSSGGKCTCKGTCCDKCTCSKGCGGKCGGKCAGKSGEKSDCKCGGKCAGKSGGKCAGKSGGKCTGNCSGATADKGNVCTCTTGGPCTCKSGASTCKCPCGCKTGTPCVCTTKGAGSTKCSCSGKCSCCTKCKCSDKCTCGGSCACCDKCMCTAVGNGILSGLGHMDGPDLVIEMKNNKKKTVVLTGNTELYPPTLDLKKAQAVNVKFIEKSGMSQALFVADARSSWVHRTWSKEAKKYIWTVEKKKK